MLIKFSRSLKQLAALVYGLACHAAPLRPHDIMMVKDPNLFVIVSTFLAFRTLLDATSCVWILQMSLSTSCTTCVYYVGGPVPTSALKTHAVVCYGLCRKLNSLLPYLAFKKYASTIASLVHHGKSRQLFWSLAIPILSGMNQYVHLIAKMMCVLTVARLMPLYRATIEIPMVNDLSVLELRNHIQKNFVPNGHD